MQKKNKMFFAFSLNHAEGKRGIKIKTKEKRERRIK